MAIQLRRGNEADLDISRLRPGEAAVCLDSGKIIVKLTGNNYLTLTDTPELRELVDGKAAAAHSHAQTDITDLDTTLAGKAAANHNHSGLYAPLSHSDAVSLYDTGTRVTLSLSGTTYIAIPSSFNLSDYKAIEVIYHQGAISGNDSFASARSIKSAQLGAFTNLSLIQLSGSSSNLSISHSVLSLSISNSKLTIVAGADVSVSRIVGWK